jgi:hypothetical protein
MTVSELHALQPALVFPRSLESGKHQGVGIQPVHFYRDASAKG